MAKNIEYILNSMDCIKRISFFCTGLPLIGYSYNEYRERLKKSGNNNLI